MNALSAHRSGSAAARLAAQPLTHRHPLLRVCSLEPTLLSDDEVDLVALVNLGVRSTIEFFDRSQEPDDYLLSVIAVERLVAYYGKQRRAKGDRVIDVESSHRRYLLPFLIETTLARPEGQRGAVWHRVDDSEHYAYMLAGDMPMPAATVAGDLLNRRGIACVWLSPDDAAGVVHGGREALDRAIDIGDVALVADVRTGRPILLTADLRSAGLLIEPEKWGKQASTSGNRLDDLALTLERAAERGVNLRGKFKVSAIAPLPQNQIRTPRAPVGRVDFGELLMIAPFLSPVDQLINWLGRLLGDRISETYGFLVEDFFRDDNGRGWLNLEKQGGRQALVRSPETGELVMSGTKNHTKTKAGLRVIPIPHLLADLIEAVIAIFHTDPITGEIFYDSRLVPGIGKENAAGASTHRGNLKRAQAIAGGTFCPHDLRSTLITQLMDAHFHKRIAHAYAGHEYADDIQSKHYDIGVPVSDLLKVAEFLDEQLAEIAGSLATDEGSGRPTLRTATAEKSTWGTRTRRHRDKLWIEDRLRDLGWRLDLRPEIVDGQLVPEANMGLLDLNQAGVRLGETPEQLRKWLHSGELVGQKVPWKGRLVWRVAPDEVEAFEARRDVSTIADLAEELDRTYHQIWTLVDELDLIDAGRRRGQAIQLTPEGVERIRAAVAAKDGFEMRAVTYAEAAELLGFAGSFVPILVRQGQLTAVPAPDGDRRRYVSFRSVTDYLVAYPAEPECVDGELMTQTQVRVELGLTRREFATLIAVRQLQAGAKAGGCHNYVTRQSVERYRARPAS